MLTGSRLAVKQHELPDHLPVISARPGGRSTPDVALVVSDTVLLEERAELVLERHLAVVLLLPGGAGPHRPGVGFEEPSPSPDGPLYQRLPDAEKDRGYAQALYELLAALAETEDRYAEDVLTDILRLPDAALPANGPLAAVQSDSARK